MFKTLRKLALAALSAAGLALLLAGLWQAALAVYAVAFVLACVRC